MPLLHTFDYSRGWKLAKTKIGGQALIEGVMMRGETGCAAMAVRTPDGAIIVETERPEAKPSGARKIPFIRGILNLVDSLKNGMRYTMKAAEIWGGEDEEVSEKEMKTASFIGIALGIVAAVLLFIFIPDFLTRIIFNLFGGAVGGESFGEVWSSLISNALIESSAGMLFWGNLVKGILKITVFVIYLIAVTKMDEMKRVFMYHGAEHKTINCFESEMELTVENVQKCSTYHDRCGTAFLFFVILVSILVTSLVEILLRGITAQIDAQWLKTLFRLFVKLLCLIPVASLSYELLMFNSRHDWVVLKPLKWLGRSMQLLSTRQPDDSMVEVAIVAFKTAYKMDKEPKFPGYHFVTVSELTAAARKSLESRDGDKAAADWIIADTLKLSRSSLNGNNSFVPYDKYVVIMKRLARVLKGYPVQYEIGSQQFFEYEFKVTPDVLIPRPETELLTERVIAAASSGKSVLDLCTGSGCIGITVALKTGANVTLSDISEKALEIAGLNASSLGANVNIVRSDMLSSIEGTFDIIASNPPYISAEDMKKLDKNVKFEPESALYGGRDGLDYYRIIASEATAHLNAGGMLFLEVGIGQAQAVAEMLGDKGFTVEIKKDYEGIDRMVVASLLK